MPKKAVKRKPVEDRAPPREYCPRDDREHWDRHWENMLNMWVLQWRFPLKDWGGPWPYRFPWPRQGGFPKPLPPVPEEGFRAYHENYMRENIRHRKAFIVDGVIPPYEDRYEPWQPRPNEYSPFLGEETKKLLRARREAREQARAQQEQAQVQEDETPAQEDPPADIIPEVQVRALTPQEQRVPPPNNDILRGILPNPMLSPPAKQGG